MSERMRERERKHRVQVTDNSTVQFSASNSQELKFTINENCAQNTFRWKRNRVWLRMIRASFRGNFWVGCIYIMNSSANAFRERSFLSLSHTLTLLHRHPHTITCARERASTKETRHPLLFSTLKWILFISYEIKTTQRWNLNEILLIIVTELSANKWQAWFSNRSGFFMFV